MSKRLNTGREFVIGIISEISWLWVQLFYLLIKIWDEQIVIFNPKLQSHSGPTRFALGMLNE